jgi:hypothetical protein
MEFPVSQGEEHMERLRREGQKLARVGSGGSDGHERSSNAL